MSPHSEASWSQIGFELIGFDVDEEGMLVDDVRSIEVSILLRLHVLCQARVVKVDRLLPVCRYFGRWLELELLRADHLMVEEEKD